MVIPLLSIFCRNCHHGMLLYSPLSYPHSGTWCPPLETPRAIFFANRLEFLKVLGEDRRKLRFWNLTREPEAAHAARESGRIWNLERRILMARHGGACGSGNWKLELRILTARGAARKRAGIWKLETALCVSSQSPLDPGEGSLRLYVLEDPTC